MVIWCTECRVVSVVMFRAVRLFQLDVDTDDYSDTVCVLCG